MRIDAHQHFWRYNSREYAWIGEGMDSLRRDFLPEHLWAEQSPLGFAGSVAVQARQTLEETEWLLQLAERDQRILAVVGWVDLRSAQVEAELERLAARPKLRGVRHVAQDEPDGFMLREDFLRGIGLLRRFGLAYDILIFARHLPDACRLAGRFPEQAFVLDHIAKPPIKLGSISPWREEIRRLAEFPNVCVKLSGMATEADWKNWTPQQLRPYLDVVMEAFGPGRTMIGSDWPVCTVAGGYSRIMGVVLDYLRSLTDAEQEAVCGITVCDFYGMQK